MPSTVTAPPGRAIRRTPPKPARTASQRPAESRSRARAGQEGDHEGAVRPPVVSARGMRARAAMPKPVQLTSSRPRTICRRGRAGGDERQRPGEAGKPP